MLERFLHGTARASPATSLHKTGRKQERVCVTTGQQHSPTDEPLTMVSTTSSRATSTLIWSRCCVPNTLSRLASLIPARVLRTSREPVPASPCVAVTILKGAETTVINHRRRTSACKRGCRRRGKLGRFIDPTELSGACSRRGHAHSRKLVSLDLALSVHLRNESRPSLFVQWTSFYCG